VAEEEHRPVTKSEEKSSSPQDVSGVALTEHLDCGLGAEIREDYERVQYWGHAQIGIYHTFVEVVMLFAWIVVLTSLYGFQHNRKLKNRQTSL